MPDLTDEEIAIVQDRLRLWREGYRQGLEDAKEHVLLGLTLASISGAIMGVGLYYLAETLF